MRNPPSPAHAELARALLLVATTAVAVIAHAGDAQAQQLRFRSTDRGVQILTVRDGSEAAAGFVALEGPIYDVAHIGAVLYVARGPRGVTAVDVINPAAPRELSTFAVGRTVVKLAVAGDQLLVIVADYATLAYQVTDPAHPVASALGMPAQVAVAAASGRTPADEDVPHGAPPANAAAPTVPAAMPSVAIGGAPGQVVAVRADWVAIRVPGVRAGERFELRSQELIKVTDPLSNEEKQVPSNELLGVVEVERVTGADGAARLPRGVNAAVGDLALPTTAPAPDSLMFPARWRAGVTRVAGDLRPFVSIDRLGAGAIANISIDHYFKVPLRVGVEFAPLSFLGQPADDSGHGGFGIDGHLRLGAGYSTDYFEVGFGVGVQFQRYGDSAFVISPRVRLGSLDGLHLIIQNDFALVEQVDFGTTTHRKFNYALTSGEIAVPLTRKLTLFLDGGGGVTWAYGILGLKTFVRGNGGPGTLLVHAGVGGAWVNDSNRSCPYSFPGPSVCTGNEVSGAGPAASIGFDTRF